MDTGPLLTGERVLWKGKANALIRPDEHGLGPFAAGADLLTIAGLQGQEAIGGQLFVTTARVLFSSHRFNRLRGRVGTPISLITRAERFRSGLAVGVEVQTDQAVQRFVNWSPGKAAAAVAEAHRQQAAAPAAAAALDQELVAHLGGWTVAAGYERLNTIARTFFAFSGPPNAFDLLTLAYAQALRQRSTFR